MSNNKLKKLNDANVYFFKLLKNIIYLTTFLVLYGVVALDGVT